MAENITCSLKLNTKLKKLLNMHTQNSTVIHSQSYHSHYRQSSDVTLMPIASHQHQLCKTKGQTPIQPAIYMNCLYIHGFMWIDTSVPKTDGLTLINILSLIF
jgi:hypothetical protein